MSHAISAVARGHGGRIGPAWESLNRAQLLGHGERMQWVGVNHCRGSRRSCVGSLAMFHGAH